QIWERLSHAAYMVFSWQGISILVEHPTVAAFDDRGRLHRTDGPALAWRDGYALYSVHGIRMSPETGAAMAAGKLTARQVLDERNAEVRRVLVAQYNASDSGRWVRDLGAAPIHSDVDSMGRPRALYRIEQQGDEPYVMIEVTNSTPELEGELAGQAKQYRFRVHPELRPHSDRGARHREPKAQAMTCQNAIASGYGFYGHEYNPVLET
ncbi:MAG TPA: hypothetical protein VLB44_01225, partial [Kofleriaceae bacterium]|nr:hypothetical protein [Kofleriaceae bacterium]